MKYDEVLQALERGGEMPKSEQSRGKGFFAIGIERSKTPANIGTLMRSAVCFGASYVFIIGQRYPRQCSDTVKSWKHVPLFQYDDIEDFNEHRPIDVPLIGVELTEDAVPLESFTHPDRAIYLLGPEDGNLSLKAQSYCQDLVRFSSRFCLNVAAAGSVVLYDRTAKATSPLMAERSVRGEK